MKQAARKGIYIIPNLFTTGNLFSGFYATVAVFNEDYVVASIAILIAMVFDILDGRAARSTGTSSRFGVEYDSLADLVSFGVAPGLLIYSWALSAYGRIGWVAAFLFVACGALRLARYNTQSTGREHGNFIGLPIPAAASMIATTVLLNNHILQLGRDVKPILILGVTYVLAFLMVSNIRYRSFRNFHLWERHPFHSLVTTVLILILFLAAPQLMLFGVFASYILWGILERPVMALMRKMRRQPSLPSPGEGEELEDPELLGK
jgi:CDP-diacylglycerol---serine O-phosphatidyltransferase